LICQHQALNDEILAAGNDPVKLAEIQQKLEKLRGKGADDFRRKSQDWYDQGRLDFDFDLEQEAGDHDHHGRGDVLKRRTDSFDEK
jgi:hypothetical protein